jgi:hypothetical protein
MNEYEVYKKAEQYGMAIETNMDQLPITFNLIFPTDNEERVRVIFERVNFSEIATFLDHLEQHL